MEKEPVLPRKEMLTILQDRAKVIQQIQMRPYTCVTVLTWYDQQEYIGFGFSKVCYPDRFDPAVGVNLAVLRAVSMAYRQVRSHEAGNDDLLKVEPMEDE